MFFAVSGECFEKCNLGTRVSQVIYTNIRSNIVVYIIKKQVIFFIKYYETPISPPPPPLPDDKLLLWFCKSATIISNA